VAHRGRAGRLGDENTKSVLVIEEEERRRSPGSYRERDRRIAELEIQLLEEIVKLIASPDAQS
jgi:hypothetical protein